MEDGREARHSRGYDPVAAWGLVVSLVLGVVAAALSVAGYLVDLPSWLVGTCLAAAVLGGVAAAVFAARQARLEHRSAGRIVWETVTAPVRFLFDVLF
ncbi:hypothetical protein [Cellulosimicrobium sp. E-16]|uniref:hypothetical protein n=1 Tax=Cellulosimicrobium sp. E-16 TaxID=3404049 RepID=UPI003CF9A06E